jgi:hypothetical protein
MPVSLFGYVLGLPARSRFGEGRSYELYLAL